MAIASAMADCIWCMGRKQMLRHVNRGEAYFLKVRVSVLEEQPDVSMCDSSEASVRIFDDSNEHSQ